MVMRIDIGETETESHIEVRRGSNKLLALLIEHHGHEYDTVELPEIIEEKPEPAPAPVCTDNRRWFAIIDDVEVPQTGDDPGFEQIQRVICGYFKLTRNDLLSARRAPAIAYPRHLAMYLGKTLTRLSYPGIGRKLGGRDHTTILHGVRKIESTMRSDWRVAYDLAHVEALI